MIGLLLGHHLAPAASKDPPGKDIFRQQCAKCHGHNGEGVKGKYDDPLQGTRPLEKLTRYIERNMPDDKPGSLPKGKAQAVAQYIFGAFYSPAARGIKPPRIELARLTNRQYLNSVADLLKEFTGKDDKWNDQRGLQGRYYNGKYFNNDKKTLERLDAEVSFDFAENKPDGSPAGTNAFCIQWRGSVRAEESGDYDFILKTPNGARLWVNDEDEPLIDAWVASGKLSEHHGKLRLIGGRIYPLKLDFFKAAEKSASIALLWHPPHGAEQTIPARHLSPVHSTPTLVIHTAFPPDDSSQGYERGVLISKAWDEATTGAAIEVATYVSDHLDALSGSKPADTNRVEKIQKFCERFVEVAFHQPLSDSDKRLYVLKQFRKEKAKAPVEKDASTARGADSVEKASAAISGQSQELEDAARRVVLLALKSPRFLYRGLENAKPDDYEIAARLSYELWDSLPGERLGKLAEKNELHTPGQIQEYPRRMLDDPRTHAKMLGFFHHWLQVDRIENLSKDSKLFPEFTPAVVADLRTSLNLFLEDAMWSDGSDYRGLLVADDLYLNERLARFYGAETSFEEQVSKTPKVGKESGSGESQSDQPEAARTNDDFVKVTFGGEKRCGVLTHPYLLASFSYQKLTSPIHRGVAFTPHIVTALEAAADGHDDLQRRGLRPQPHDAPKSCPTDPPASVPGLPFRHQPAGIQPRAI